MLPFSDQRFQSNGPPGHIITSLIHSVALCLLTLLRRFPAPSDCQPLTRCISRPLASYSAARSDRVGGLGFGVGRGIA